MAHTPSRLDRRLFAGDLGQDEELLGVIHRHWIALIAPIGESLIFGIVIPAIGLWVFQSPWQLVLGLVAWALAGCVWTAYVFYDWFCDAFLLTAQSLVLLSWKNIVSLSSERIDYTSIESVQYDRKGVLPTLFRYGRLEVETANGSHVLTIVARPHAAQEALSAARDAAKEEASGAHDGGALDVEALRRALRALLAQDFGLDATDEHVDPPSQRPPDPPRVIDVTPPNA